MIRLHLGCGSNFLPGWNNFDSEVDITKKLPFFDNYADAIFIEHCVEHVASPDAMRFFEECRRVLKPGGALRVSVPCMSKIFAAGSASYAKFCHDRGFASEATTAAATRAIVCHHGHLSVWTPEILTIFLLVAGFPVSGAAWVGNYKSQFECMRTGDDPAPNSHWRVIGREFDDLETITCEAMK